VPVGSKNQNSILESYLLKLKHILPAFVVVTFGTVIGFGLLRWLLCLRFSIVDIREDVWAFWLPLVLPWLPIRMWLRLRFRKLTFKVENERSRFFYHFISWGTISVMLFISQAYITTATGSLETLVNINDIEKTAPARYYKVENFSVAPYYGGTYAEVNKSGKYGEDLHFNVYFVTPIVSDTSERISRIPKSWYAVNFSKRTSNWTSRVEKEKRYRIFFYECLAKMNKYDFQSLDHFERIPASELKENYLKAIQSRVKQPTINDFIVLKPLHEKYEDRNGNKLPWTFGSFGIGLGVLLLALIRPGYTDIEA
jgi:rhomboid protease GluP